MRLLVSEGGGLVTDNFCYSKISATPPPSAWLTKFAHAFGPAFKSRLALKKRPERFWCRRGDLNPHEREPTAT